MIEWINESSALEIIVKMIIGLIIGYILRKSFRKRKVS